MYVERLLTGSRWEILQELVNNPQSTSELAKTLGTSQANISQQLKQLELAGLVERRRSAKKTKHYTYAIIGSLLHLTRLDASAAQKKELRLDETGYLLARALLTDHAVPYLTLLLGRPDLTERLVAIGGLRRDKPELFVLAADVDHIRQHHSNITVNTIKGERSIALWSHTPEEVRAGLSRKEKYFEELMDHLIILADPEGHFHKIQEARQ